MQDESKTKEKIYQKIKFINVEFVIPKKLHLEFELILVTTFKKKIWI